MAWQWIVRQTAPLLYRVRCSTSCCEAGKLLGGGLRDLGGRDVDLPVRGVRVAHVQPKPLVARGLGNPPQEPLGGAEAVPGGRIETEVLSGHGGHGLPGLQGVAQVARTFLARPARQRHRVV